MNKWAVRKDTIHEKMLGEYEFWVDTEDDLGIARLYIDTENDKIRDIYLNASILNLDNGALESVSVTIELLDDNDNILQSFIENEMDTYVPLRACGLCLSERVGSFDTWKNRLTE